LLVKADFPVRRRQRCMDHDRYSVEKRMLYRDAITMRLRRNIPRRGYKTESSFNWGRNKLSEIKAPETTPKSERDAFDD